MMMKERGRRRRKNNLEKGNNGWNVELHDTIAMISRLT
jgi:hypothetical protein